MSIRMPARHWTNIFIAGFMLLVDGVFASDTRLRVDDLNLIPSNVVELSSHAVSDPAAEPDMHSLDSSESKLSERSNYSLTLLAQASNVSLYTHHYRSSNPRAPPVSVC